MHSLCGWGTKTCTVHVHVHVQVHMYMNSPPGKLQAKEYDQIYPSFKLSEETNTYTYTKVLPPLSYTNINYCIYM